MSMPVNSIPRLDLRNRTGFPIGVTSVGPSRSRLGQRRATQVFKVPSAPAEPVCSDERQTLLPQRRDHQSLLSHAHVRHGSMVATNTVLGKGACRVSELRLQER